MLTHHAIRRCRERKINASILSTKVNDKDFIVSLTQPDGCQICWTIIEDKKVHFIYKDGNVITVLNDGVIPSYMSNIISDRGIRKKFFKRYGKEGERVFRKKKNKFIEEDHNLQIRGQSERR